MAFRKHNRNNSTFNALTSSRESYTNLKNTLEKHSNYITYLYSQTFKESITKSSIRISNRKFNTSKSFFPSHFNDMDSSDIFYSDYSDNSDLLNQSLPLDFLKGKVYTLNKDNKNVYQNTEILKGKVQLKNIENDKIKRDILTLIESFTDINDINSELRQNLDTFQSKFNKEIDILEDKLSTLKNDQNKLKQLNTSLNEIKKNFQDKKDDYIDIVSNMRLKMDFIAEKQLLFNETSTMEKKINEYNSQLNAREKQINELIEIKDKLQEEVEVKENEIYKKVKEINIRKGLIQDINHIKERIGEYAKTVDELYSEIDEKEKMINIIKANYDKVNQKLGSKVCKNKMIKSKFKEKYIREKEKGRKLIKELENLQKVNEGLILTGRKVNEDYEKEIGKIKREIYKKKEQFEKYYIEDKNKDKEKEVDMELVGLLKENKQLKNEHNLIVMRLKELPKIEGKLKEIFELNIKLKEKNFSLVQGMNLEVLISEINDEENEQ